MKSKYKLSRRADVVSRWSNGVEFRFMCRRDFPALSKSVLDWATGGVPSHGPPVRSTSTQQRHTKFG